jgi:hypothetical protein
MAFFIIQRRSLKLLNHAVETLPGIGGNFQTEWVEELKRNDWKL